MKSENTYHEQCVELGANVAKFQVAAEETIGMDSIPRLTPRHPNPENGFEKLNDYLIHCLTKRVIQHMEMLCQQRRTTLDFGYWKQRTREILSATETNATLIVPSRAGSGKSTWILSFVLTLSEYLLEHPDHGATLGGILLVFQKVEDLNVFVDQVEIAFPHAPHQLMVSLQSWTPGGAARGFCKNKNVTTYEDCDTNSCPHADTCQIKTFSENAGFAFILGMTQVRFQQLRLSEEIHPFLYWKHGQGDSPVLIRRRYLIFDEKISLVESASLTQIILNDASSEIEYQAKSPKVHDFAIARLQRNFSYLASRTFQQLRRNTTYENMTYRTADQPYGISTRESGADLTSQLDDFYTQWARISQRMPPNLSISLRVMAQIANGTCFFEKQDTFCVTATLPPSSALLEMERIVFDATALVDGDYTQLENKKMLDDLPSSDMTRVTFHMYSDKQYNVSKEALSAKWKLNAFTLLIDDIIDKYPGKTFLCAYQRHSTPLMNALHANTRAHLVLMDDQGCIPYFNGTNGSNAFKDCTNVILLGYPRLRPSDYMRQAFVAWGHAGFAEAIKEAMTAELPFQSQVEVPMLDDYIAMHLAARLEQEIYRCDLRNAQSTKPVHIFLFQPPKSVWEILMKRFCGANIMSENAFELFDQQKAASRTINGKPTAYSKLSTFFTHQWDGEKVKLEQICSQLEISKSAWKDFLKSPRGKQLLAQERIVRKGRGEHVYLYRECNPAA